MVKTKPGYTAPPEPDPSQPSRLFGLLENALRPTTETSKISVDAGAAWTVGEIEEAACDAFESVSDDFLWDGMRWTYWEAEDRVVDFLEYSDALDVLTPVQRGVLQRVLAAVALADGKVERSEEQLLQTLLNLENAAAGDGELPSHNELLSINTKTLACAVITFGYAIASVDGNLSGKEERILDIVCARFGLGTLKQWELKRIAQAFCVDEVFAKTYQSGNATPAERVAAYKFAKGLGHFATRDAPDRVAILKEKWTRLRQGPKTVASCPKPNFNDPLEECAIGFDFCRCRGQWSPTEALPGGAAKAGGRTAPSLARGRPGKTLLK